VFFLLFLFRPSGATLLTHLQHSTSSPPSTVVISLFVLGIALTN
jgi:hypothetical protein